MTIYHVHHIVPKHMGGSDDPENLIKLTLEEHAEAHRILYEQYNNEHDRIAWLALSGMINKKEAIHYCERKTSCFKISYLLERLAPPVPTCR